MLAVRNRRASQYVPQVPAAKAAVVVALAGDAPVDGVASPARMLQAELATRLAGGAADQPARSLRWRAAIIFGAALLAWVPVAGAVALFFA